MSLYGTFTNCRTAMDAQSHCLGQIGSNLANINTTAYKRSETNFKTILSGDSDGSDCGGVASYDRRLVNDQGLPVATDSGNDLTIVGSGFFLVNQASNGNGSEYYTRDGSFSATSVLTGSGESSYLTTNDGLYVMGWNADLDGNFSSGLEPICLDAFAEIEGQITTSAEIQGNIDVSATTVQHLNIPIYDDTFTARTLNASWEKADTDNFWDLTFEINEGTVTSPTTAQSIRFNDEGALVSPADGIVSIEITWNSGSASEVELNISDISQFNSDTGLDNVEQNGYAVGKLQSTQFNSDGVLMGYYDNSQILPISKVAIVDFVSPENLNPVSGNLYQATSGVGDERILSIGDADCSTSLRPQTLEASNVELADEFTKMIITQKAYSSAATVFKTGDEMFQQAAEMKR